LRKEKGGLLESEGKVKEVEGAKGQKCRRAWE